MSTLTKLAWPPAILLTFALASAPAHAQFEGTGDPMAQFAPIIEQFAPMMQRMQSKIGKKRMARMMQMVEPLMSMMAPGGDTSPAAMPGMEGFMNTPGAGPFRQPRRRHK